MVSGDGRRGVTQGPLGSWGLCPLEGSRLIFPISKQVRVPGEASVRKMAFWVRKGKVDSNIAMAVDQGEKTIGLVCQAPAESRLLRGP